MTDRVPATATNLDIYGNAPLEWSRVHDLLANKMWWENGRVFMGTVRPDGRPHAAGVGSLWMDGDLYTVSGPKTLKSKNLEHNPACTLAIVLEGVDLILEGDAHRVTDAATLEKLAQLSRENGWPTEVQGDAFTAPYSAPSAGPPPWWVYKFTYHTAVAVASAEPHGATKWTFE